MAVPVERIPAHDLSRKGKKKRLVQTEKPEAEIAEVASVGRQLKGHKKEVERISARAL